MIKPVRKKNPQLDAKRTSETNLKTLDRVRAPSTQNPRATVTHLIHVRSTSFTIQSFGVGSCNFKNGLPIHTTDPTKFSGCHTNYCQCTVATPFKMKIGRIGLDEKSSYMEFSYSSGTITGEATNHLSKLKYVFGKVSNHISTILDEPLKQWR